MDIHFTLTGPLLATGQFWLDVAAELLLHLAYVEVEAISLAGGSIRVTARTNASSAACLGCRAVSRRVHSRYERRLLDTAIGGREVVICRTVRRFLCLTTGCPKATFAEQVGGLTSPHARRRKPGSALTEDALAQRLHALGISPRQGRATALFTLAAEVPAAILAKPLGIHVRAAIQWQDLRRGLGATPPTSATGAMATAPPALRTPASPDLSGRLEHDHHGEMTLLRLAYSAWLRSLALRSLARPGRLLSSFRRPRIR